MTNDNWKHRAANMKCQTCMWFVPKVVVNISKTKPRQFKVFQNNESNVGRCRRHAPTISGYPVVFATDWCGDHKLDENKI